MGGPQVGVPPVAEYIIVQQRSCLVQAVLSNYTVFSLVHCLYRLDHDAVDRLDDTAISDTVWWTIIMGLQGFSCCIFIVDFESSNDTFENVVRLTTNGLNRSTNAAVTPPCEWPPLVTSISALSESATRR
jgi:hypothetical protein